MKSKLRVLFLYLGIFIIEAPLHAQTTATKIIDYTTWSTNNCNAFSSATTISGLVHLTNAGQPTYKAQDNAISMECGYYGSSAPKGAIYEIGYNFVAGHNITISIEAAAIGNSYFPVIYTVLTSGFTGANAGCNGPGGITPPSGSPPNVASNSVISTTFTSLPFGFGPLTAGYSKLLIYAAPDQSSMTTSATQWIEIRKITITDVTPAPPPTFSISATGSNSVPCGGVADKVFTIQNHYNTPNVTSYVWHLNNTSGGSATNGWRYNGAPAPNTITTTSNTLLLSTVCGTDRAFVSATAVVGSNSYNTTNTIDLSFPLPTNFVISGPDNYNSTALPGAQYSLYPQGGIPTGDAYCNSTYTWSTNNTAFYKTSQSDIRAWFTRNGSVPVYDPQFVITGKVQACGQTATASKVVNYRPPVDPLVMKRAINMSSQFSVMPNPSTDGHFTISFGEVIQEGRLLIYTLDGKLCEQFTIQSQLVQQVDLGRYAAGTYIIRFISGATVITEKLVRR